MNIIEKAKQFIYKEDFNKKWESLFENGETQSAKIIYCLWLESHTNERLKYLIKKNRKNMPELLYRGLFGVCNFNQIETY